MQVDPLDARAGIADAAAVESGPPFPLRLLAMQACLGAGLGYVVLHPLTMVIFHWLDPRAAHAGSAGTLSDIWSPVAHSFGEGMLPMGFLFALLGAGLSSSYGYFHVAVLRQRDRLACQLARTEEYRDQLTRRAELLQKKNRELAELALANRRASQFIVHNFKTSLSCIRGFTAHLLELPAVQGKTALADPIGRIGNQARRMTGAVSDLLDLARLGETRELNPGKTDVSELMQDAVAAFAAPGPAVVLSLGRHHAACPAAMADRRLLLRVLTNLIENAVKHNRPGTRIVVDAESKESGSEVLFSCRDDGEGIPNEVAPFVFKEFVSAGADGGQSSGLGLSFCKAVVEAHGGRIWFETSIGAGTRFLFTISRYEETENVHQAG